MKRETYRISLWGWGKSLVPVKTPRQHAKEALIFVVWLVAMLWIGSEWEQHRRAVARETAACLREAHGDSAAQVICVYGEERDSNGR